MEVIGSCSTSYPRGNLVDGSPRVAILSKIRPKTAILRTRGYYTTAELVLQFKTHIWGLIETNMGGYFHAASSLLQKIDDAHYRFVRELGLSPEEAFLEHRLAPPSLRRSIGILGLLHKRVLGKCHPSFDRLLPWWISKFSEPRGRGHNKQLYGHWVEISHHQAIFQRSIFGMIDVYNDLPQGVVDSPSVSAFQHSLTHIMHIRCRLLNADWASSFSRHAFAETSSAANQKYCSVHRKKSTKDPKLCLI